MLKACVSYSKKVPVDGLDYSSQGYSLTLETEIPESDPGAIQARLHSTFDLVKATVEQELANGHGRPAEPPVQPRQQPTVAKDRAPVADRASNKQVKYLTDLWTQGGGAVADLNARIRTQFGVGGLYELSRKQASALLDELQNEFRKAA